MYEDPSENNEPFTSCLSKSLKDIGTDMDNYPSWIDCLPMTSY